MLDVAVRRGLQNVLEADAMKLPRIAGLLTGNSGAYDYLGDSIEAFPRGQAFCELLGRAGYRNPVCCPLSMGIASIYTAEA